MSTTEQGEDGVSGAVPEYECADCAAEPWTSLEVKAVSTVAAVGCFVFQTVPTFLVATDWTYNHNLGDGCGIDGSCTDEGLADNIFIAWWALIFAECGLAFVACLLFRSANSATSGRLRPMFAPRLAWASAVGLLGVSVLVCLESIAPPSGSGNRRLYAETGMVGATAAIVYFLPFVVRALAAARARRIRARAAG